MQVTHCREEGTFNCSCNHFQHVGILCRHIFCVLRYYRYEEIPERYILRRYCKDVVPTHLLTMRYQNPNDDKRTSMDTIEVFATVNQCVAVLSNEPEKMKEYLSEQLKLKKKYVDDCPPEEISNRNSQYAKMLGVSDTDVVDIQNPVQCRNKGRGSRGKRLKSKREMVVVASTKAKRLCAGCHEYVHHDKRNCPSRKKQV